MKEEIEKKTPIERLLKLTPAKIKKLRNFGNGSSEDAVKKLISSVVSKNSKEVEKLMEEFALDFILDYLGQKPSDEVYYDYLDVCARCKVGELGRTTFFKRLVGRGCQLYNDYPSGEAIRVPREVIESTRKELGIK